MPVLIMPPAHFDPQRSRSRCSLKITDRPTDRVDGLKEAGKIILGFPPSPFSPPPSSGAGGRRSRYHRQGRGAFAKINKIISSKRYEEILDNMLTKNRRWSLIPRRIENHPVYLSGVGESEARDGASKPNLLWRISGGRGRGHRHRPFYQVKRNVLAWMVACLVGWLAAKRSKCRSQMEVRCGAEWQTPLAALEKTIQFQALFIALMEVRGERPCNMKRDEGSCPMATFYQPD